MAFPVIKIGSATAGASDTLASGAGPAVAVTGTANGSTNAAGLVVTLGGAPDLSGVATDGSAAIYLADATAGARNFGRITAVDNSAKTVTVDTAFGVNLTGKSWAIGGTRATLGGTNSLKLFDNNSASGDAMPGWTVELQSGHVEALAAEVNMRRSGDTTSGPITLRGAAAATTKPVLALAADSRMLIPRGSYLHLRDFTTRSTGTKTTVGVVDCGAMGAAPVFSGLTVESTGSSTRWVRFFTSLSTSLLVENCDISGISGDAIPIASGAYGVTVRGCYFHDIGGRALNLSTGIYASLAVIGCRFARCAGGGIYLDDSRSDGLGRFEIERCTFDACGTTGGKSGLEIGGTTRGCFAASAVENCVFTNNSGWGLSFSTATVPEIRADGMALRGLVFNANSSGEIGATGVAVPYDGTIDLLRTSATDPQYTNAAGGDYTPTNTALWGAGYPGGANVTPGAIQPAATATPGTTAGPIFARLFTGY